MFSIHSCFNLFVDGLWNLYEIELAGEAELLEISLWSIVIAQVLVLTCVGCPLACCDMKILPYMLSLLEPHHTFLTMVA